MPKLTRSVKRTVEDHETYYVCDGPCGNEGKAGDPWDQPPETWIRVNTVRDEDGLMLMFCSWTCVATYAVAHQGKGVV
ncbi:MAG TPA: hypothetical protein VIV12_27760, partial [Streptosporangiaceae bacterium]